MIDAAIAAAIHADTAHVVQVDADGDLTVTGHWAEPHPHADVITLDVL